MRNKCLFYVLILGFGYLEVSTVYAAESNFASPSPNAGISSVLVEPGYRMRAKGYPWDHEIQIALPASYYTTKKAYPVLWVTDGSVMFKIAVQLAGEGVQKHFPELIIVAVGVPPESAKDFLVRRVYDFSPIHPNLWKFAGFGRELVGIERDTEYREWAAAGVALPTRVGGAPKFSSFLVDVLRPALAKRYRMSGQHTLFGDSAGGFFCTYVLLSRPDAFDKYICGSPTLWMGASVLFHMEDRYARSHKDLPADVFFGAGEGEVVEGGASAYGIVSSMTRMAELLNARRYPSLRLHVRIVPAEKHVSVMPSNLRSGLQAVWEQESGSATQ